ncbi:MAG TPA: FeoA family protein [Candidatus Eisenbacteria bacterium]|jgi:Fe2+ transport system protein FeoA|nr:FeoA family protein [Candidatus Eisenbacteria bacterium]HEU4335208.1 FeoA family protein [Candidatus Eisenbacteria bacterium]
MTPSTIFSDQHLAGLLPGERALVRRVFGAPDFSRRMSELGLVPGTEVRMIRRAPFGDPIEFVVRGTHFSIRRDEAEGIRVVPV